MRQFGLIGYPLSHSFSKKYFSEKFLREDIADANYELYPIERIDIFPSLVASLPDLVGINVTIPYKEQVIPYLDALSDVVAETGACNCIHRIDGKLVGYNTDVIGFEKSLLKKLNASHQHALVLGTGGAAKAVHYVLRKLGISYKEVSRKNSNGCIAYEQLDTEIIKSHTLIINTTPLGMHPLVDDAPEIPYESLTSAHYLFDLVYNPAKTLFLAKGEACGAAIENGADMLVDQAEASWDIWNGNV